MRNLIAVLLIAFFSISFIGDGNIGKVFPSVEIKTLEGEVIESSSFVNIGKPTIVSFWSTTCVPCIKELNAINSKYAEWKKETGLEVYAISTDDARFQARVPVQAKIRRRSAAGRPADRIRARHQARYRADIYSRYPRYSRHSRHVLDIVSI